MKEHIMEFKNNIFVGNGLLGFVLKKENPKSNYYTITKIHKSRVHEYPKNLIGGYLTFINGQHLYKKSIKEIQSIRSKRETCSFNVVIKYHSS